MTRDEIEAFYREEIGLKNENTIQLLAGSTRFLHRRKGAHLKVAGEDLRSVLFRLNGVARCYLINDEGEEHTHGFCCARNNPITGAIGISSPVIYNIDAATDMDLLELPLITLQHAIASDATLLPVVSKLATDDYERQTRVAIGLKGKNGTERYRWFVEEFADIIDDINQKDIASFLELQPQSLSRIKHSLSEE